MFMNVYEWSDFCENHTKSRSNTIQYNTKYTFIVRFSIVHLYDGTTRVLLGLDYWHHVMRSSSH